jgi:hypothetical protein
MRPCNPSKLFLYFVTLNPSISLRINSVKGLMYRKKILRCAQNYNQSKVTYEVLSERHTPKTCPTQLAINLLAAEQ